MEKTAIAKITAKIALLLFLLLFTLTTNLKAQAVLQQQQIKGRTQGTAPISGLWLIWLEA